ncbi:MAG: hypothetical protein K9L68_13020 [Spirochaetales bacterium]|nr:hypothetical protein [Spirochaetales bacterium]
MPRKNHGKAVIGWLDTMADNASEQPTMSDNASGKRTMSDNVGEEPTREADSRQLTRTTVRLALWQKQELRRIAEREGRLLSDVVRDAVRQFLKKP